MANIVIVFESRYGQAQKIASHIADRAHRAGHDARTLRASLATQARLEDADGYVVVAPVYFGQHPRELRSFLGMYGGMLERRPLAFVSVGNAVAQRTPEAQAEAMRVAHRTLAEAALHPIVVACAAGALAYPRYGFFVRQMMRLIARSIGAPTTPTRIHELTDWPALDRDLAPFFATQALDPTDTPAESGVHPKSGITRTLAV